MAWPQRSFNHRLGTVKDAGTCTNGHGAGGRERERPAPALNPEQSRERERERERERGIPLHPSPGDRRKKGIESFQGT